MTWSFCFSRRIYSTVARDKKNRSEFDATNPCSLFKNTYCSRPPQLSLPTAHMDVANYLEVTRERKEWDKPRCVQDCLHILFFKRCFYKNLQLYVGFIPPIPVFRYWYCGLKQTRIIHITECILLPSWMKGPGLSIVLSFCQLLFRAAEWSFYVKTCNKG